MATKAGFCTAMTVVRNSTRKGVSVTIEHACGRSWRLNVRGGSRHTVNTLHRCGIVGGGIFVTCDYGDGRFLSAAAEDYDSLFVGENQITSHNGSLVSGGV